MEVASEIKAKSTASKAIRILENNNAHVWFPAAPDVASNSANQKNSGKVREYY